VHFDVLECSPAVVMVRSFSQVVGRYCSHSGKTVITSSHGGDAARPLLVKQTAQAAICTMGARAGRLKSSLQMRIRAETNATLMIDSTMPVKLLPSVPINKEYGIGIHASVENGALLAITPCAHVPHLNAHTGLWTRYDLSPGASLVSVQLADLLHQTQRPPDVGGRYTTRTRVHHALPASKAPAPQVISMPPTWSADDSIPYVNESCAEPATSSCGLHFTAAPSWRCDWTYGRRFKGLVMGTKTTNVISSVVLAGPRAEAVVAAFRSLEGNATMHSALGLLGDSHVALQHVALDSGELIIARMGTERREDMHRLLHHCLQPLESHLGVAPYARMLNSQRTMTLPHALFHAAPFISDPSDLSDDFGFDDGTAVPTLHVQHGV